VAGPSSPVLLETIDVEVQLPTGDSLHMQFPPDVTLADIKGQVVAIIKYASPGVSVQSIDLSRGLVRVCCPNDSFLGGIAAILMCS
jgi:hypothetical protein